MLYFTSSSSNSRNVLRRHAGMYGFWDLFSLTQFQVDECITVLPLLLHLSHTNFHCNNDNHRIKIDNLWLMNERAFIITNKINSVFHGFMVLSRYFFVWIRLKFFFMVFYIILNHFQALLRSCLQERKEDDSKYFRKCLKHRGTNPKYSINI